jgi:hypothetical protein
VTRSKLMQLTAIALLVWALSCIAIYWIFVGVLGVPSVTAVVVVGLTILVTSPFVAISTAINLRRVGDSPDANTDKWSTVRPLLLLIFGFGSSAILVLAAIAAVDHGMIRGGALMAIGAAVLLCVSTWQLRSLRRLDS